MPEKQEPDPKGLFWHPVEIIHRTGMRLDGNLYLTVEAWRMAHDEERLGHALNNAEQAEVVLNSQYQKRSL